MLSLIIENVFEDRKWNPSDYLHVLYNGQITEIFRTLGKIIKTSHLSKNHPAITIAYSSKCLTFIFFYLSIKAEGEASIQGTPVPKSQEVHTRYSHIP